MATIRTRTRKDGSAAHTVVWRDPDLGLKSRTFTTQQRAQDLKDFLDANSNSLKLATQAKKAADRRAPTVADIVEHHLTELIGITEGTRGNYRRLMERHLEGTQLATTAAEDAVRKDVRGWLDGITTKSGDPASWKTRANLVAIVSAAYRTQAREGKMTANPAEGALGKDIDLPDREPVLLTVDQLKALRERVTPRGYALLIWTLTATGMRWGEAIALRVKDLRLNGDRSVIHVWQAFKRGANGTVILGTPKTRRSSRLISIPADLADALADRTRGHSPDDLVFTNSAGGVLTSSRFHRSVWHPLVDRLIEDGTLTERPWVREIRNAHCTHLLQAGVRVDVVQKRLGHESPATTLGVYARMTQEDDYAAAAAVDW
ncbi:site-specific integrase [Nesterenkonia sp. HG001]|uniref:tyrosine-type recombinase/integrase n=1 Tax=Nesterenkonia sp. HG001 TaxID=2983207 RepID=UPI002AC56B0A|nr:site-specific integrase [Nesterenkonia sp. HG001]MDZ5076798.1 site-specific integrase [Nesterenkonia sp. HG001]